MLIETVKYITYGSSFTLLFEGVKWILINIVQSI